MAQIQPIATWYQGEEREANVFSLYNSGNNLIDTASFTYQLIELIGTIPEEQTSQTLITGDLTINGSDYNDWLAQTDPNTWIYNWAAEQLNLILIS
jgi:hypothetical protein